MAKKHSYQLTLYGMAAIIAATSLLSAPVSAVSADQYRLDNGVHWTNPSSSVCMAIGDTGAISVMESSEAAEAIFKFFISTNFTSNGGKPLSAIQAAAFMGNFFQESRYNPAIIQGGKAYDATRAMIPSVGGYGFGLVQWDGSRRVDLLNFAKSKGANWRSLNLQLAFIKHELEGKETRIMRDTTFRTTDDIETATKRVRELYERPGAPHDANRVRAARQAYEKYKSLAPADGAALAGAVDGDATEGCAAGLSAGNGNVADAARRFSWPKAYRNGARDHQPLQANSEYAAAIKKVGIDKCGHWAQKIGASCDAFVATVLRFTGVDTKFPCGGSGNQDQYMKQHTETFTHVGTWSRGQEKQAMDKMQPGDILARSGHVSIYLGNGREADASIGQRTAEQFQFILDGTYNVYRAKTAGGNTSL